MIFTKSGHKLDDVIKKAIHDGVITNSEYDEIMNLAHQDGHIDKHEKILLKELQNLIADKIVKRISNKDNAGSVKKIV
jgi:uncharacterized membrane protein YebE (DUF533 family)